MMKGFGRRRAAIRLYASSVLWFSALCLVALPLGAKVDDPELMSRYQAAQGSYQQWSAADNFHAALPHAREAYQLGRSIHGERSRDFASLAWNYGLTLLEVGLSDQALPLLSQALSVYQSLDGRDDPELVPLLGHLATAAARNGNRVRARRYADRGLDIVSDGQGGGSLAYATFALQAGIALAEDGAADAERYLMRSYAIQRNLAGERDPGTALAAFHLGQLALERGELQEALPWFRFALPAFEENGRYRAEYALLTHSRLVEIYERLGRSDEATRHCLAVGEGLPEVHQRGLQPLYRPPPEFPESARAAGREGQVLLELDVNEEGFVDEVKILDVDGHEDFGPEAAAAARRYRFAPRFVNGKPVAAEDVRTRLSFKLDRSG